MVEPPRFTIFEILELGGNIEKTYVDVSLVQSHPADLLTPVDQFFSSKAVWRGPGRPKLMSKRKSKKICSKKGRLPTFCGPENWQTSTVLLYF